MAKKTRTAPIPSPTSSSPYPSIQDNSIALGHLQLVDLSEEDKAKLKTPRDGFAEVAFQAINAAMTSPQAIGLSLSLSQALPSAKQKLEIVQELQAHATWLAKKLEVVEETILLHLDEVREVTNQLVKRARTLNEESPAEATDYTQLIDHYGAPARKGSATRKRNARAKRANPTTTP